MNKYQLGLLIVCVLGVSFGQIFFKLAALSLSKLDNLSAIGSILFNPYLCFGMMFYVASTVLWVWLLRSIPLQIAYPTMALAFLIVPVLGALFVNEPLQTKTVWGGILILLGVYIIGR